jgi:hypothetical protein
MCSLSTHMDDFCVCFVLAMFGVLSSSIFWTLSQYLIFCIVWLLGKERTRKKSQVMRLHSNADASCAPWLPQERSLLTKPASSGKCSADWVLVNGSLVYGGRQRWSWLPLPTWSTWHLVREWVISGRQTTPPLHGANLSQWHHVDMLPQNLPQVGTICSYTLDSRVSIHTHLSFWESWDDAWQCLQRRYPLCQKRTCILLCCLFCASNGSLMLVV